MASCFPSAMYACLHDREGCWLAKGIVIEVREICTVGGKSLVTFCFYKIIHHFFLRKNVQK